MIRFDCNRDDDVGHYAAVSLVPWRVLMERVDGGWRVLMERVDGGWRVLMESGWRVEGFDGEWMEGGAPS